MSQAVSADLTANILKVLSGSQKPLASAAIHKALPVGGRPKPKLLAELLTRLELEGVIIAVPRNSGKYAEGPVEAWVRSAILTAMTSAPQTEAKLVKAVTSSYANALKPLLVTLKREGRIYEHPPLTKTGKPLFGLSPPSPITYLAKDLDKLIAGAVRKGFTEAEVRHALARFADHGSIQFTSMTLSTDSLIAAMRRLEPRIDHGAAVPLAKLRQSLAQSLAKPEFDAAVLKFATSGVLELQSHAWPERLTEAERAELISNGRGGWFDSVALSERGT